MFFDLTLFVGCDMLRLDWDPSSFEGQIGTASQISFVARRGAQRLFATSAQCRRKQPRIRSEKVCHCRDTMWLVQMNSQENTGCLLHFEDSKRLQTTFQICAPVRACPGQFCSGICR